ncbi:MAG: GNAT family N-acetyltransferase, partial [Proteobacteria bacterium]|nr:GNAT family N-acetyltransferase [Pseudomonadota bacterium]
ESEWKIANEILNATVHYLYSIGKPLWTEEQISIDGLKNSYKLNELHFVIENDEPIGVVFLQTSDPIFWPEIAGGGSLFFHKLAMHPKYMGKKKGNKVVELIVEHAIKNDFTWIRLDCNDRQELLQFYQNNGFSYVDTKIIEGFNTARHQLLTTNFTRQQGPAGPCCV